MYFAFYLVFAAFFWVSFFITKRKPTVSAIPRGRQMSQFCTNPAIMYITKEMPATLIA